MSEATLDSYSRGYRMVELSAVGVFSFSLIFILRDLNFENVQPLGILSAYFWGALIADFASGLVHWFADTWGSHTWFLIGPTLIRSFREHHVDPKSITRHDFIETNGSTALVLLPFMALFFILSPLPTYFAHFCVSFFFFIFLTNQIHKWAHQNEVPRWVGYLQKSGIILSREKHAKHHNGIHDDSYCITTGWINSLLQKIKFFRFLEYCIESVTGARARAEDLLLLEAKKKTS